MSHMTITLRQETASGATTKGSSLTYAELDNNFVDLLGNIANLSEDTTPQLGGSLDVNGQAIVSVSNGNIAITPNGSGQVQLDGLNWPTADGSNTHILQTDGGGNLSFVAAPTGGIASLVADSSPELGGNLDINSNNITGNGEINITGFVTAQSALNAQSGTTYTTVLTDASKLVTLNNGSAITVTIPVNSGVQYPVGTKIDIAQLGAGQVTVAGAGGVNVYSTPTLKLRAQYSGATCIQTSTDNWLLVGDLAAS